MSTDDYDVGYGKPPKHTRFKKGESGNPKGRKKGSNNLRTDLLEEMGERITVNEGGKQVRLTKQRAMIKALLVRALKGDTKAIALLLERSAAVGGFDPDDQKSASLKAEDQAILDDSLSRHTTVETASGAEVAVVTEPIEYGSNGTHEDASGEDQRVPTPADKNHE